jgi:hypothetical protein
MMSGTRSKHGRKIYIVLWWGKLKERKKDFENVGVDWWTINGCRRNRMGGCKTAETSSREGKVVSLCERG